MFFPVLPEQPRGLPGGRRLRHLRLLQRGVGDAVPRVLEAALGRDLLPVGHHRPEGRAAGGAQAPLQGTKTAARPVVLN